MTNAQPYLVYSLRLVTSPDSKYFGKHVLILTATQNKGGDYFYTVAALPNRGSLTGLVVLISAYKHDSLGAPATLPAVEYANLLIFLRERDWLLPTGPRVDQPVLRTRIREFNRSGQGSAVSLCSVDRRRAWMAAARDALRVARQTAKVEGAWRIGSARIRAPLYEHPFLV